MNADAEFSFKLARQTSISDFIAAAESAGWRFDDDGSLAYVTDNDLFDWLTAAKEARDDVVREMESMRAQGKACGFVMTHQNGNAGCIFIVTDSGTSLIVTPNKNIVPRAELDRFADGEWYLGRLLPIFAGLPLVAYSHSQDLT